MTKDPNPYLSVMIIAQNANFTLVRASDLVYNQGEYNTPFHKYNSILLSAKLLK